MLLFWSLFYQLKLLNSENCILGRNTVIIILSGTIECNRIVKRHVC